MRPNSDIDFVVSWVNGDDPEWQAELNKYKSLDGDIRKCRFRNWNNLKYLFRSFDNCAPWVRKVHLVTWGHTPAWINRDYDKLNIVRHEDFLLKENLPVFSSHPIELNLHRISGLSERFVYFNDDMFLLKHINEQYFFEGDLPKDMCVFNAIFLDTISHIRLNDILAVNKYFSKRDFIAKNFFKVFNFRYRLHQIRSLLLLPWPQITGFYDPHQPQPYLKKTFEKVWSKENELLSRTSSSRFRRIEDANQYLFRYWQLLCGEFSPRSFSDTHAIPVRCSEDILEVHKSIISKKFKMLCINDELEGVDEKQFDHYVKIINTAFEQLFPAKSSFEV